MTTTYHPGQPVGFRGTRAVVLDVRAGRRCDRVRINWPERLPERICLECDGRGWLLRGKWLDILHWESSCDYCRGRGELPSETVHRTAWVDADDLTEPPEREMPPGGEDVAALLAAMGGES